MSADKTEKATAQRLKKAAEKGDVVFSKEAAAAVALFVGSWELGKMGPRWAQDWRAWLEASLELGIRMTHGEAGTASIHQLVRLVLQALRPVFASSVALVGCLLLAAILQRAGSIKLVSLRMDASRLNPATAMRRVFQVEVLTKAIKSMLPLIVIAMLLSAEMERLRADVPYTQLQIIHAFISTYRLLLGAAVTLMIYSLVDLWALWRSRLKRLMMTKQERRDESKEMEGNPQTRRRLFMVRRQLRRQQRRGDVSRAKLVVTNPTEYAVGLAFDFESLEAPRVVAKGRNLAAAEIREDARAAGVPIVENPPLARSLFREVTVGSTIPVELYAVVAAILSYLFRSEVERRLSGGAKTDRKAQSLHNTPAIAPLSVMPSGSKA